MVLEKKERIRSGNAKSHFKKASAFMVRMSMWPPGQELKKIEGKETKELKIKRLNTTLDQDYRNILVEEFSENYKKVENLSEPENIVQVMNEVFHLSERAEEYMYLICMTSGCRPIGFFELAHGTHNAALVGVREIFIRALLCGAAGIVLVHNHPGGLPNPSREDVSVTDKVRAASELIGIQLYDHIIVGRDSWFSFTKEGKLTVGFSGSPDYYDNR